MTALLRVFFAKSNQFVALIAEVKSNLKERKLQNKRSLSSRFSFIKLNKLVYHNFSCIHSICKQVS